MVDPYCTGLRARLSNSRRVPDVRRTACNRDCPDACSLLVTVEEGRAVRLQGDPADPVTQGFLCERTARFLDRQHASERFTRPMLRSNGRLIPVSWEDALDVAADKLLRFREESGAASVLHYRSGGSLGILRCLSDLVFERFGPVTLKRGDICSGAGEAAQERDFGLCDSHDLFDLRRSGLVVLWGKNPHTSGVHLVPLLLEARQAGRPIVGLDPVRTRAARVCSHFYQPRPGGDFFAAMGVARRLFDLGGVDPETGSYCDHLEAYREMAFSRSLEEWAATAGLRPDDLREIAGMMVEHRPVAILVGWGLARRRNGSAAVRALDALGAVSGNLGVPGGGVSYYFRRRGAFDTSFVEGRAARTLPEARLGPAILEARDPSIRMIWVTAGNPISMLPDSGAVREAFRSSEFNVVVETHPTDTTDEAHLVLPTLTLLEDEDLLGAYGNHFLRASTPALAPPGEARHEFEIWSRLASRLGLGDLGQFQDWKRRACSRLEVGPEALAQAPVPNPFAETVLFSGRRFRTRTGRVDLIHEIPCGPPETREDLPLTLLAVSTPKAQSSQWSVPPQGACDVVTVHPDSAGGVEDGGRARLASRKATVEVTVRHDPALRPDVALMPKGGMLRHGCCPNLLIEAVETDDGGGAAYYDELVRLEPCTGSRTSSTST